MADDDLKDRRCQVTISSPTDQQGNYSKTVQQVLTVSGIGDQGDVGNRIQFKVTKTDQKEPNTCEVTITNLNQQHRNQTQVKNQKILLQAGYASSGLVQIFKGDSRSVDHKRTGGDWETLIKLADGGRGYQFARYTNSFKGGSTAYDVANALVNATGLDAGNLAQQSKLFGKTFQTGYAVHGPVNRSLDKLLCSLQLRWSIQDGAIQIRQPGEAIDSSIPDITPDSGLIDSPEMGDPEKKGKPTLVKFKSLICPVYPGKKVHLRSARYDSDVYVKRVDYEGDTAGGPWYVVISGIVLQPPKATA